MPKNMVRARVVIRGTRTLLQHHFGPEAIPLEKSERVGVAGNNPEEWRKTCLVDDEGFLFFPGTYIFGCLKNGAFHTKRGRGSLQPVLVSTLEVEEDIIRLNRKLETDDPPKSQILSPDMDSSIFLYVASVRNPATKARNVRYRLATKSGWKCSFVLRWDKTVISREQMKSILRDSGTLGGLGDGLKIGCGRFEIVEFEEISDAEEETTSRTMEEYQNDGVAKGQKKMSALRN